MSKRAYPFDDGFSRQLKVHVGQKQVNNNVSSEERMQEIYAKTLNLLKTNAKTFSHRLNNSAQIESMKLSLTQSSCKIKSASNLKQMLLTNEMHLILSDKIINDTQVDLCNRCKVRDPSIINSCSYCAQILCSSCMSACVSCSELFCQNCSQPLYNCKEQYMCLGCYR